VATLATLGSGRGWLGAVVARHAAGRKGGPRPMGAFSTGVRVDWGLSQRPVLVDCGLSYTTVQATIARSEARLWLVHISYRLQ